MIEIDPLNLGAQKQGRSPNDHYFHRETMSFFGHLKYSVCRQTRLLEVKTAWHIEVSCWGQFVVFCHVLLGAPVWMPQIPINVTNENHAVESIQAFKS